MPDLGPAELIIVLIVVVFIFGGTRLAELGGSLGKGVKEFRQALKDDPEGHEFDAEAAKQDAATEPGHCNACGFSNSPAARFCADCGKALTS